MRATAILGLVLIALPFAALPAGACTIATIEPYPDVNYTTVCANEHGETGDGTQTTSTDYVAHVSHAVEADPAFDYAHADAQRGTWVYDDGETQQQRQSSDVGAGAWEGARGLVGTGAQADVAQRDQTVPEDEGSSCASVIGRSTCAGASGWFTVQDVASVGAGVYYQQVGSGADCQEAYEVDLDAALVFVPVTTGPGACATQMPWMYDAMGQVPGLP